MNKQMTNNVTKMRRGARDERGFTAVQMVITLAIIIIVSTFAVLSIAKARDNMRLAGSARELAGYIEKARADALRRHGTTTVQISNGTPPTTYSVTMDFNGDGATETRNFLLQSGVQFSTTGSPALTLPYSFSFDWRGRTASNIPKLLMSNSTGTAWVQVGGGGDLTINGDSFVPTSSVSATVSTAVPTPTPTSTPTPTPSPTPTSSPTPTPSPTPKPVCTSTQKPSKNNCVCPVGQTVQVNGKCA